jgi:hypothetical protein
MTSFPKSRSKPAMVSLSALEYRVSTPTPLGVWMTREIGSRHFGVFCEGGSSRPTAADCSGLVVHYLKIGDARAGAILEVRRSILHANLVGTVSRHASHVEELHMDANHLCPSRVRTMPVRCCLSRADLSLFVPRCRYDEDH